MVSKYPCVFRELGTQKTAVEGLYGGRLALHLPHQGSEPNTKNYPLSTLYEPQSGLMMADPSDRLFTHTYL